MGLGTLVQKISAVIITNDWYNDFLNALAGDFVGRNTSSGAPEAGKNLGNALYPWGTAYIDQLFVGGTLADLSDQESAPYKIVSGATRSGSNQPDFLRASGSGATATLRATSTPLVLEVNGEAVTIAADVSITGLTVAPSSNNTALVNENTASDQATTRLWGEHNRRLTDHPTLTIDNAGSEVTALVGQYVAFKLAGVATEYLLGFLKSSTELIDVRRGFFVDSSGNPVNRTGFTDNDTLTLMKLAWVFAKSDGTVDISYKNPSVSASEPSAPVSNDYWFDLTNRLWKQYDGASWNTVERHLVGLLVNDSTNCVASRSFDFFCSLRNENSLEAEYASASTVRAKNGNAIVGVMGEKHRFWLTRPTWDIASHLAASADMYNSSEQASTPYFLYLTDTGLQKISDIEPYWRADYEAWYHPHQPWRCLFQVYNDASSNFLASSFRRLVDNERKTILSTSDTGTFQNAAAAETVVTNLDGSISVMGGRRVRISLVGQLNPGAVEEAWMGSSRSAADVGGYTYVYRANNSSFTSEAKVLGVRHRSAGSTDLTIPPQQLGIDNPGPGQWWYRVKTLNEFSSSSPLMRYFECHLLLEEIDWNS